MRPKKNHTTIEKELLVVVFSFDKFRHYLVLSKVIVCTDHLAIKFMLSRQDAKPRLIRWILLLQEFDLEIKDKKGPKNFVANHLSCLEPFVKQATDEGTIHETFLDEHLLVMATLPEAPWYANIVNYLSCKVFPPEFEFQERKRLVAEAKQHFWYDLYLYKVCGDDTIRHCGPYEEVSSIFQHCHCLEAGGHHGPTRIAYKVLQCDFFWPTHSAECI